MQKIEYAAKENQYVEWTAPKWAMPGDIVFFFHAKTAIDTIRRLEIQLEKSNYNSQLISRLNEGLKIARTLYKKYGAKIFAVGRVADVPFYDNEKYYEDQHWKSRNYVRIENIQVLKNPISIDLFREFLQIYRQSSITPVYGEDFLGLKELIVKINQVPDYFLSAYATPFPLRNIDDSNWIEINSLYNRAFLLESAFREFYVNYFLKNISDKRSIYRECKCKRNGEISGYVDNCIWLGKKLCLVEVKLNWDTERDFFSQLEKYCNADEIWIDKKMVVTQFLKEKVIVIDKNRLGVFSNITKRIEIVCFLNDIMNTDDLKNVQEKLISLISDK